MPVGASQRQTVWHFSASGLPIFWKMLTFFLAQCTHAHTHARAHAHAHTLHILSVTAEQWHAVPAPVCSLPASAAAAGGSSAVHPPPHPLNPPDATHVIPTCHLCQLHFNTLGRLRAEKGLKSGWQTACSDPTFTASLTWESRAQGLRCSEQPELWQSLPAEGRSWGEGRQKFE